MTGPENLHRQLYALYLTRFAAGFGLMTLVTLLPTYINEFEPSRLVLGLFVSAVTVAKTGAIVPLAWAGDRYDKRQVLLFGIGLGVAVYAAFAFVASSLGFITVRAFQGVTLVATGLLSTALVGQLAPVDQRANAIGKANAWRLAAGIVGALAAGQLSSSPASRQSTRSSWRSCLQPFAPLPSSSIAIRPGSAAFRSRTWRSIVEY
uniref:MFS transporter n=1 Tax=Halobiforma nitratireducens TaxID=130048 RepID=UPI001EF9FAC3|nr:MFS transporter [Halobiforma nitratireducens]